MISFVQKKALDYERFSNLLIESEKTNAFTNSGPCKRRLEKLLEERLNIDPSKAVVCLSNGTTALHSLYYYYEKRNPKMKWASPSFTFASVAVGKDNVDLLDIDPKTFTIPLTEEVINKYDGFVLTNLFGTYPSNILEWQTVCREKNKVLIFDNASSPLTSVQGVNISNYGNSSFGSLHHTKILGFGEGGFVVVDKESYQEINSISSFGFDLNNKGNRREYQRRSSNFKMSDVAAAAIAQHIENFDLEEHLKIQNSFVKFISTIETCKLFNYNEGTVYGNLPIVCQKNIDNPDDILLNKEVQVKKYYYPLRQTKNSMNLFERILNFPLHAGLNNTDITTIKKNIKRI